MLVLLLLTWFGSVALAAPLPVVLFHGMGDTCCNPLSLGRLETLIRKQLPGVEVYSLRFGRTFLEDELAGFFQSGADLVASACAQLRNITGPINAIGFSQGGQFIRAFVQQCNVPRVRTLITLGAQHQGVFGMPKCRASQSWICEEVRRLIDDVGVYDAFVQRHSTQANYWHDALDEQLYLRKNVWLPVANNAITVNETYKLNLMTLERFVMVKFLNDTMVQPRESSWFGFYAPGQDKVVQALRNSSLYSTDALGLRALDEAGKLVFVATLGDHLQFTDKWFVENIVPYLK